jgi:ribose transport system permease protein
MGETVVLDKVPARRQWTQVSTIMRQYGIIVITALLFIGLSVYDDSFRSSRNILNILDQNAPLLIIACTQTLVIITGGFDLSVGAVFALAGITVAKAQPEVGTAFACLLGLTVGLGLGAVNGILISKLKMNTFIATLASSYMFYGLAEVITHGFLISVVDPSFRELGNGSVGPVKSSVILAAVVIALSAFVLHGTVLGRYLYAIGGNAEAARLSGIRVDLIRTMAFALNGMAAGLAGLLATSRIAQAQSGVGETYPLTTIAAVVIGGTSISGGEGAVWRSVLGVLLLAMIGNAFNLFNVNPIYQQIVTGAIIVLAVASYSVSWRQRRAQA